MRIEREGAVSRTLEAQSLVGTVIGKYELLSLIETTGDGAALYKAVQVGLERAVALKLLFPQEALKEGKLLRFQREQQATAQLNHGNIVTVYDSGVQDGYHYYVTEFLQPQSLRDRIKECGPLSSADISKIGQDILSAFAYTHEKRILHRNVSANSIGFDLRGNAVVKDFAAVKVLDDTKLTNSGELVGKSFYMAPEQLLGQAADERCDLYLISAVLYEMATGQRPFAGPPPCDEKSHKFQRIVKLNEKIGEELASFIEKGLRFSADERHQSARAMKEDLAKIARRAETRQQLTAAISKPLDVDLESKALQEAEGSAKEDEPILSKAWLLLPAFFSFFVIAVLVEHTYLEQPKLYLVEHTVKAETGQFEVEWRANLPCYTFAVKHNNLPPTNYGYSIYARDGKFATQFRKLKPGTTYHYRFFFSHRKINSYKGHVPKYYSKAFTVRTLDEVKFLDVACRPMAREARLTWQTSQKCKCLLRFGPTPDCLLEVDVVYDSLAEEHSAKLTGLKRETKYFFFIETIPSSRKDEKVRSKLNSFTTLENDIVEDSPIRVEGIVESSFARLENMSDNERNALRKALDNYLLLNPNKALPLKKKVELATTKTSETSFNRRLRLFALWLEQLKAVKAQLPYNENTIGKLQALQQINLNKACKKLDLHFKVLYQADRVMFGN